MIGGAGVGGAGVGGAGVGGTGVGGAGVGGIGVGGAGVGKGVGRFSQVWRLQVEILLLLTHWEFVQGSAKLPTW